MANYYCDHGRYTYSATPTWGVAQEGDGLSSGVATAATVSIDLSGISAVSSNTLTVAGVVCTVTGSYSGGGLADHLAGLINASTGTVNAATTSWCTPKLKDAVYARGPTLGAPANTLQIMTRAGSAVYNSNSMFQVVSSGFTGGSVSSQFSGGASGAWGYLVNDYTIGAIWPSAIAAVAYGVFRKAVSSRLAGVVQGSSDTVHVRGNGAGLHIGSSANSIVVDAFGKYLWDDGTVWSGDTNGFTITSDTTGASVNVFYADVGATAGLYLFEARTFGGLVFSVDSKVLNIQGSSGGGNLAKTLFRNVKFVDNGYDIVLLCGTYQTRTMYERCWFKFTRNVWYSLTKVLSANTAYSSFDDCTFEWTNLAVTPAYLFDLYSFDGQNEFAVRNCKAIGASPRLFGSSTTFSATWAPRVVATNCSGFSMDGTLVGLLGKAGADSNQPSRQYIFQQNVGAHRGMRYESTDVVFDWIPGQGYPTLNSLLPDGTYYSYRILWSNTPGPTKGIAVPVLSPTKTNLLADGQRTVTLELMIPSDYASQILDNMIGMSVCYVSATDGKMYSESTRTSLALTGSTLPTSTAAWSGNSYSGTHVARKITLTTQNQVAQNTEIECSLFLYDSAPSALQTLFMNPELGIA